jgi:hypothetical protein
MPEAFHLTNRKNFVTKVIVRAYHSSPRIEVKTVHREIPPRNGGHFAMNQKVMKFAQRCWKLPISPDFQVSNEWITGLPSGVHPNFLALLARDVWSEGDSQPLYDYIQSRKGEMSADFLSMMELWLQDEQKHYEAMRRCFHAISGIGYDEMDDFFLGRSHELEPIKPVLKDEFTILVALAFDELGSTMSYRRDVDEYYRYYPPGIAAIGRHLYADEGVHFGNAIALLKRHHQSRLGEVESTLKEIIRLEAELGRYTKTFFLDHAQEVNRFPPFFNERISAKILGCLGVAAHPAKMSDLWKWRPKGCERVPIAMDPTWSQRLVSPLAL